MKRTNVLRIILEAIVILGSFVIGGTILMYNILDYSITRTLVGLIVLCVGLIGAVEFVSSKIEIKLKTIQSIVVYLIGVVLGIVLAVFKIDSKAVCIIWAVYNICFSLVRIFTSSVTILKQPLLNAARIVCNVTGIVFSIIFICQTTEFLKVYFLFCGIILLIESSILTIEFIIHRNQNL